MKIVTDWHVLYKGDNLTCQHACMRPAFAVVLWQTELMPCSAFDHVCKEHLKVIYPEIKLEGVK